MTARDDLRYRPATADDDPAVLDLLRSSLGWRPEDPDEALFAWKHRENAFGRSPAWVATSDGRVVGYRTFMRWEFADGGTTHPLRAVRAVDTATHPDFRGLGIFRTLTLAAVDELSAEGVDLVFNTPNDQSRPGYLSMGWQVVGRLPVAMRPRGPAGAVRALRARVPADLWSRPSDAGAPAAELLADDHALTRLLGSLPPTRGVVTARSPAYLRWRYTLPELQYRAVAAAEGPAAGLVVFRLRRRGPATELAVVEALTPSPGGARRLVTAALRQSRADYAIAIGAGLRQGLVPVPRQGPLLATRRLASTPPGHWSLSLGDIELF